MKNNNPKTNLLEHSEAKVQLYGAYLSRYLNILSRVDYVQRIFLFDLLCGEGILENGGKGSPIVALDAIRNHYYSNHQTCPNLTVWFNDWGNSEIEKNIPKIERVRQFSEKLVLPPNVQLDFFQEDYETIYPRAINLVNETKNSKGLFFIDPYGYKSIKPSDIEKMLQGGNTEVFLWLPISFMYRFANSAFTTEFSGSEPLREFLQPLFGKDIPKFKSAYGFVEKITGRFRAYLREQDVFVDFFTLERDSSNLYCMLFFTSNLKGAEMMISAKWEMDSNRGKGHTIDKSPSFSEIQMSGYGEKLKSFITSAEHRTNSELYRFGLENGFLPKHTKDVLKIWKSDHVLQVVPLDGKAAQGFYIEYKSDRLVGFQILKRLL